MIEKNRVISLIHPENCASVRVAERIGERLESRIEHVGREMLCFGIERLSITDTLKGDSPPNVR